MMKKRVLALMRAGMMVFGGTMPVFAEADTEIPAKLKFIPYYVWANRGENEMTVWVKKA